MKGESDKMHHRLEVYIGPGERDFQKTADILNDESSKNSNNESPHRKVTVDALRKTAKKWLWDERISLESANKILKDAQEMDETFQKTNKKIIKILEDLIDFLEDKFQSIYDNVDDYATSTQMNVLNNAMNILDKAIYNYRLSCGRSTDNTELHGDLSHAVTANVQNESKLVYSKEVRQRIQNIGDEPDTETQKFLDEVL